MELWRNHNETVEKPHCELTVTLPINYM